MPIAELAKLANGAIRLLGERPEGQFIASAPHTDKRLDIPAPAGYTVSIVYPTNGGITRGPLTPYSCESGVCEPPDDPLDECNDDIDNDEDGHADLCDWNCLPHADFGANNFPEARSRIEDGKTYALLGGGSICTDLGDTWTVEFADMALHASELLADIRPEMNDRVHFRIFSCWVFSDEEEFKLCQYGPYESLGNGQADYHEPICPPGMEDYPYGPTEEDQLNDVDQANLYFSEAIDGAWRDFELNSEALGMYGEPVNGVVFLTSDTTQTCKRKLCSPLPGLAYHSTDIVPVHRLGSAVVTNANPFDWHTLAHEVGHTLGLWHDVAAEGFMNHTDFGGLLPILGVAEKDDNIDNNLVWDEAMRSKGSLPRSSGWRHTGCEGHAECAPLGKPGWTCNGVWCLED